MAGEVLTTEQLRDEFRKRADMAGLVCQCLGDGSTNSTVAIVGEAPGDREVQLGSPLVGPSGALLWPTLRKEQLTRPFFYVTNVSKRIVSSAEKKTRQPISKNELDNWKALLQWELLQLPNLTTIFICGDLALEALTGKQGITQWRGSVFNINLEYLDGTEIKQRTVKVVCTINPAAVILDPKLEIVFRFDCHKLKRLLEGRHRPTEFTFHINPTASQAIDFIRHCAEGTVPVAFDIECIGGETACVGLAERSDEGMCIPWRGLHDNFYSPEDELSIRGHLHFLFYQSKAKLIAQNGMFDTTWLWFKDKLKVKPLYADTMLAHHTLYPMLPHNLGFLTTAYTDNPYYKDEGKEWREGGDIDGFWRYNIQDCCNTLAAWLKMDKELQQAGLSNFFFSHVMRMQHHLALMTVGGIKIDKELKDTLTVELTNEVNKLHEDFLQTVEAATGLPDYKPNPGSWQQLSDLFFNKLKLIGRGSSTNKENRDRMYAHPRTDDKARLVLRAIDAWSEERKFLSTYVESKYDEDGRMRCEYKQIGVARAPGRLSSASVMWGSGMNLQNQPERAHAMFIADEGYEFFYFDLSQAEARVVGWLAGIAKWKEQFEKARLDGQYDCHRALASEMFGVPYEQVPTKDRVEDSEGKSRPTIRYIAKRCRHGLNYRMGPDRLSSVTGLSRIEANRAYELYHKITPELKRWWWNVEQEVRKERVLYNAYGRPLPFMERISEESLETIVAFKPQSTIGDKVNRVIYMAHDDPDWPAHARIALNIHDALVGLAPIGTGKKCLQICKKYAEEPIIINGEQLIIPMEAGLSKPDEKGIHRWSTIKKLPMGEI